jgi:L-ascorbate metabolism protein UlaG (beta-lactamase superfamily)
VPLGISSHLISWGVNANKIAELDWHGKASYGNITFICAPAQHFSGRVGPYENKTLWASWIIETPSKKVFYSGDSGYSSHFKTIGDRYGPFDLTIIENGQYNEQWRPVHLMPDETIQAFFDLKGQKLLTAHWGMFNLSLHNWYDPIEATHLQSKLKEIDLLTPQIGQVIDIEAPNESTTWWKPMITHQR